MRKKQHCLWYSTLHFKIAIDEPPTPDNKTYENYDRAGCFQCPGWDWGCESKVSLDGFVEVLLSPQKIRGGLN